MSMETCIIYGYGFKSECEDEKLVEFIKSHKETFCKSDYDKYIYEEMLYYIEENGELEDFFDTYCNEVTGIEGKGAPIANIMTRETGIRFSYCEADDACGTEPSILFEERLPWNMNEKEITLTEKELCEICKKYMSELGIEGEPEYLDLEYYG